MVMESTRPAGEGDLALCAAMLDRALVDVRAQRGGATLVGAVTPEQLLGRWRAGGGAAEGAATFYLGEFNHVVVGLAAATAAPRPGMPGLSGRIECYYVDEGARGVGVGSALLSSLVQWCRTLGCQDVDALALPGDRASKQRLEAAGFTARLLTLSRPLN
jgi:GNAT superfamily N-acetyltransferase